MRTLLVLAAHPDFAETIRAGLNPEQYRVVHRADAQEAEPLLAHGLASACIVDLELLGRDALRRGTRQFRLTAGCARARSGRILFPGVS